MLIRRNLHEKSSKFPSNQGHPQRHFHSKTRQLNTQIIVKWSISNWCNNINACECLGEHEKVPVNMQQVYPLKMQSVAFPK